MDISLKTEERTLNFQYLISLNIGQYNSQSYSVLIYTKMSNGCKLFNL